MNKTLIRVFVSVIVLISSSLACQLASGRSTPPPEAPAPTSEEIQPEQPVEQATEAAVATEVPEDVPTQAPEPLPTEPEEQPDQPPEAQETTTFDTEFPLPDDVQNFMATDVQDSGINFQTSMSMEEVIIFYRQAFKEQGLVERDLLTVVTEDTAFSMVFDGAPNNKAVVVQGVVLGEGLTNVNIRYEDV